MKAVETNTSEDDTFELGEDDITLIEEDDLESLDSETIPEDIMEENDKPPMWGIEGLQEIRKRIVEISQMIERIEALDGVKREGLSFQLASNAAVELDLLIFRLGISLRQISQRLLCSEDQLKNLQKPSANETKRREEDSKNLRKVRGIWQLESIRNVKGERIGTRAKPKNGLFSLTPKERNKSNLIPFPGIKPKDIKKRAAGEK